MIDHATQMGKMLLREMLMSFTGTFLAATLFIAMPGYGFDRVFMATVGFFFYGLSLICLVMASCVAHEVWEGE